VTTVIDPTGSTNPVQGGSTSASDASLDSGTVYADATADFVPLGLTATVALSAAESDSGVGLLSQADSSLIHLDQFRADPRFSGIDGHGVSVVVLDTGIDLNHGFFGPDANHNGVADRIVYSYDFTGSNSSDASDRNGLGSNVASIIGSQDGTYTGMAPGVNADSSGNFLSNIGVVSGGSIALQSLEASFHQDLNGDGRIGLLSSPGASGANPATIEANGSISMVQIGYIGAGDVTCSLGPGQPTPCR
jgi:hypothetical protein